MYKVYINYGYMSEELLAECDTIRQAVNSMNDFVQEWGQCHYERIEVMSFADDGEAITHAALAAQKEEGLY